MMMDLQTALVCVGFVVVSAALLLFISMVVTKEKSYEEAIAEQRQQTSNLLGTQSKSKLKDKKQKKAGKKVKEKLQSMVNDADAADDSENTEPILPETEITTPSLNSHPKHHVEFKEPQVLDEPVKEITKKDDAAKQELSAKEKPAKQKQNTDNESTNKTSKKAVKHQTNEIIAQNVEKEEEVVVAEPVLPAAVVPQTNGFVSAVNGGKDKKKKKSEQNAIQQLAGDKQGVNLPILTTLVRKAELSRSEVQILIDMLLNKQHEAPAVIDEWSEGKADPVQKLKRQLAEKEKLLVEEQEALVGAQAKLKEVRAEQTAERSQLQQRARGLEEALNAKQGEIQAVNGRLHGVNQKIQTLQAQINDEVMKNRQLLEDNNAMQMHRQQFEIRLTQAEEVKETMQNDIRNLTEQFENQKSVIVRQQYDLTQKEEVMKQLEEARLEMERHVNMNILQNNDLKVEISQLKTACQQHVEEVRRLELSKGQSLGELQTQQDEYESTISLLNQELQRVKDEKQEIETSRENEATEEKKAQVRIKNLQNELSSQLVTVERLQIELDEQREKNNAEVTSAKQQEQLSQRKIFQRLFPSVTISESLPQDQWISQMEDSVRNYVADLEKPKTPEPVDNSEVLKLQVQIQKNKQSLDEYDNLLNNLQSRTAQTEMEWRKEMEKKNAEIVIKDTLISEKDIRISSVERDMEALKEQMQQLRLQLSEFEVQLLAEREVNQRLTNDALILRQDANSKSDSTVQVERLQEEVNRMSEQLSEEQRRNKELRTQIDTVNNISAKTNNHSNTSNGPSVTVENNGNQ